MKKYILPIVAISIFTGCGSNTKQVEVPNKLQKATLIDKKSAFKNIVENKNIINYVSLDSRKSIKTIISQLAKINNKYYIYNDKNIFINKLNGYRIFNIDELNYLLKQYTQYSLKITTNKYIKSAPKVIKLIKNRQRTSILDEIKFTNKNLGVLSNILEDIGKYANGWNFYSSFDTKQLFESKTHINFSGSLREFIDYLAISNNLYVDYDFDKKRIVFSKYKIKRFVIKSVNEKIKFNNTITVSMKNDNQKNESGVVSSSEYDSLKNIENLLKKIIIVKAGEFYNIQSTSGEIVVKTTPDKMKLIENFIDENNINSMKQIYLKITLLDVKLKDIYQYGINWGYVDSKFKSVKTGEGTDANGNKGATYKDVLTKSLKANTGGFLPSLTEPLVSPAILKLAQDKGISGTINMLHDFGDVTISHQMPIVTLNHIPAVYNISQADGYIKEFTASSDTTTNETDSDTQNTTSSSTNSAIAPKQDVVTTGSYMYVKPSIYGEDIVLSIKMVVSSLKSLEKQSFGSSQYVQTPSVAKQVFSQNIKLNSGEKIIIGGIIKKRDDKAYNGMSPYNESKWNALLGNKSNNNKTEELVLVIEAKEL